MPEFDQEQLTERIRDLADSFSVNSKYSNRLWFSVILSSFILMFPHVVDGKANLPFDLASVELGIFYQIGYAIVAILTLAFCQSYIHTSFIAQHVHIEFLSKVQPEERREDFRKLFGFMINPSITRVYPLVESAKKQNMLGQTFQNLYYLFLKLIAIAIVFCMPILSVLVGFSRAYVHTDIAILKILDTLLIAGVSFPIFQVVYNELFYLGRVRKTQLGKSANLDG